MIRNAKKKCEKQLGNVDISEPTVHHGLRENNLQTWKPAKKLLICMKNTRVHLELAV